jgi:hypothetical protein
MPLFQEQFDGNAKKPHGDVNAIGFLQMLRVIQGSLFSSSNSGQNKRKQSPT